MTEERGPRRNSESSRVGIGAIDEHAAGMPGLLGGEHLYGEVKRRAQTWSRLAWADLSPVYAAGNSASRSAVVADPLGG